MRSFEDAVALMCKTTRPCLFPAGRKKSSNRSHNPSEVCSPESVLAQSGKSNCTASVASPLAAHRTKRLPLCTTNDSRMTSLSIRIHFHESSTNQTRTSTMTSKKRSTGVGEAAEKVKISSSPRNSRSDSNDTCGTVAEIPENPFSKCRSDKKPKNIHAKHHLSTRRTTCKQTPHTCAPV